MAVRELTRPPAMAPLFARAGLGMVPGAAKLPWLGTGRGREVPDLTLVLPDVALDAARLGAYRLVCGFGAGAPVPATYPHILAFPLQLSLMSDPQFPFAPIGLVHIYNRITQHRPVDPRERLSLRVWAGPLEPHPRLAVERELPPARMGDELVWEEVSTNLRRGSAPAGSTPAGAEDVASASELPFAETWRLPGDLGRRYGSVSGDLNPIHIHPLSARVFGFRSAIAHGMWTKARCLAALAARLPESFTAEAAFRKPIYLPGQVTFVEAGEAPGMRFGVMDAKRASSHLDGRLSLL